MLKLKYHQSSVLVIDILLFINLSKALNSVDYDILRDEVCWY